MKLKVFGLVVVLHVAVLGLLLQPGCNTVSKTETAQAAAPIGNEKYSGMWQKKTDKSQVAKAKGLRVADKSIQKSLNAAPRTLAYSEPVEEEIIDLSTPEVEKASVYTDKNEHYEYVVAKGDSLWKIASINRVNMRELMKYNGLSGNDYIQPGQTLLIPGANSAPIIEEKPVVTVAQKLEETVQKEEPTPLNKESIPTVVAMETPKTEVKEETVSYDDFASSFNDVEIASATMPAPMTASGNSSSEGIYEVKDGDSLYIIALHNNTSVDKLRRFNNLEKNLIIAGQKLKIPGKYKGSIEQPSAQPVAQPMVASNENAASAGTFGREYLEHVVQTGEFPALIASKYNMDSNDLLALNNIKNPRALKAGTTIKVINPERMLGRSQAVASSELEKDETEAVAVRLSEPEEIAEEIPNFDDFPVVRVGS